MIILVIKDGIYSTLYNLTKKCNLSDLINSTQIVSIFNAHTDLTHIHISSFLSMR